MAIRIGIPTSVISRPNPKAKPVTTIVNVAMPTGMLRRRWIVSFQVRSSNGARNARTSGFGARTWAGGAGRVIEVSMLAA
jgi:hypothetical protein